MKLHWFSPLPPARTGIAAYTAELLPFLAQQADVVLWTDQETWDADLEKHAEVRRYSSSSIDGPTPPPDEQVVYQIGNSAAFHASIWRMAQKRPGLIVLHDLHLMHFFCGLLLDQQDTAGFVQLMSKHYGASGRWAAQELCRGRRSLVWLSSHFPLFEPALENTKGVVVHTAKATRALKRWGACPVLQTPLPYAVRPRDEQTAAAEKTGPAGDRPYRLVQFGHIGSNRCLPDLLKALATFPERNSFVLDVYGEVIEPAPVIELIEHHNLAKRVRLHGHTSEALLDAGLDSADMAVNLRYPTMGEGSHSQLRLWNHALPTLVTRTGWYASLPDEIVVKMRPHHLPEDIHQVFEDFLREPELYRQMGRRGYQWLQEIHNPHRYVQKVLEFAQHVCAQGARIAWNEFGVKADRLIDSWIEGKSRQHLRSSLQKRIDELMSSVDVGPPAIPVPGRL